VKQEALDKGVATIRKNYESSAKKGKLTAAQVEERMRLVRPTLSYAEVAQADIVVEAVFEDMASGGRVPHARRGDETGRHRGTNTSTLDVNRIADSRAGRRTSSERISSARRT